MGGYPLQLTDDELLKVACLPFAEDKSFFTAEDETRLKEKLKLFGIEGEPQSCR